MTGTATDPPPGVPPAVASALEGLDERGLRAVIDHARRLLAEQSPGTHEIEARPGETVVDVTEHDGYSIVTVERSGTDGADRGPFAYRVTWVPEVGDGDGRYRWHYLGPVEDDWGGD